MKIDESVLAVLNECTVQGKTLFLPPGQLDRKQYEAVNKCLEAMGGKWNRKAKGHMFDGSPAEALESAIRSGTVTSERQEFQSFPTPAALVARMVELAGIEDDHRVLEPSAGTGNILKAIGNAPDKVAVELNPRCVEALARCGVSGLRVHEADFLACDGDLGKFDRVLMNPPFHNGADIQHIKHALTFLKPGGRLVAICAGGPRQQRELQPIADTWEPLPEGTFKESGTGVNAVLLTMNAPNVMDDAPPIAGQSDREYQTRIDAQRVTAEFGQKSTRRLDAGKRPITDAPLFGGPAQGGLF